jgi:glyceraldehyde 3-phosphate dehydrogenase
MAVRVGINGLGRIGRAALKLILDTPEFELVAVNDIGDISNMAYLLKYDTVYGRYERSVDVRDGNLVIDGKPIKYLSQKDPTQLGWGDLGVEMVFESTGIFTKQEDAAKHIQAGAKWVIISGPTSSEDVPTVVHGVNRPDAGKTILSCASCTTNNITPIMEIMQRHFGIEKAIMTTVHAYTATQMLVDSPGGKKDVRRGRAAAANWVPASTGAATAAAKALPEIEGLFDGVSIRGPVPIVSMADVVLVLSKDTTAEAINDVFRAEAATPRYQDVLGVAEDELVSSDLIKDPRASVVQLDMTRVVAGNLVKVMSWYDNEWGFTNQMIRTALETLGLREPAF